MGSLNPFPALLDALFGDNPGSLSTLTPKALWIEFWGPTEGVHRQPIFVGPIKNNGQAKVTPDIDFTVKEDCVITHIQIVDEDNNPLITFSPSDFLSLPPQVVLNEGDSLRITSFNLSFYD